MFYTAECKAKVYGLVGIYRTKNIHNVKSIASNITGEENTQTDRQRDETITSPAPPAPPPTTTQPPPQSMMDPFGHQNFGSLLYWPGMGSGGHYPKGDGSQPCSCNKHI
jgi:hypothetical protein